MVANRVRFAILLFLASFSLVALAASPDRNLRKAAKSGDIDLVRNLITAGADVNDAGRGPKLTALHLAVEGRHIEVVKLLLDSGSEINTPVWSPLHVAAAAGHQNMALMLLDLGAEIEAGENTQTPTPLHVAVWAGNESMVSLLIERGADIHARDVFLTTALHWATAENQLAIAEYLIEAGADLNPRGQWIPPAEPITCTLGAGARQVRKMHDGELMELAGSTGIDTVPPAVKMEYGRRTINNVTFRCLMPTLLLPWSLGSFPEIEEMLGGLGFSAWTPLDIAYAHEEMAEMTMALAAHGARLAAELAKQEED